MKIIINGKEYETENNNLIALLYQLGLNLSYPVLIEHNGKALHHSEWMSCQLNEGDILELMEISAGG